MAPHTSRSIHTCAAMASARSSQRSSTSSRLPNRKFSKLHRQQNEPTRRVQKDLAAVRAEALAAATRSGGSPDAQVAEAGMLAAMKPIGCIESCFPAQERHATAASAGAWRARATAANAQRRKRRAQPRRPRAVLARVAHLPLPQEWRRGRRQGQGAPPRLGGQPVGMFACRTPHRPCAIGLSLVTLLGVEDDLLVLAGADLVDGTPIPDVKPFVPYSDTPPLEQVRAPPWVAPESGTQLRVRFSTRRDGSSPRCAPAATRPLARCASWRPRRRGGGDARRRAAPRPALGVPQVALRRRSLPRVLGRPRRHVPFLGRRGGGRGGGGPISPADTIGETVAAGSE